MASYTTFLHISRTKYFLRIENLELTLPYWDFHCIFLHFGLENLKMESENLNLICLLSFSWNTSKRQPRYGGEEDEENWTNLMWLGAAAELDSIFSVFSLPPGLLLLFHYLKSYSSLFPRKVLTVMKPHVWSSQKYNYWASLVKI